MNFKEWIKLREGVQTSTNGWIFSKFYRPRQIIPRFPTRAGRYIAPAIANVGFAVSAGMDDLLDKSGLKTSLPYQPAPRLPEKNPSIEFMVTVPRNSMDTRHGLKSLVYQKAIEDPSVKTELDKLHHWHVADIKDQNPYDTETARLLIRFEGEKEHENI